MSATGVLCAAPAVCLLLGLQVTPGALAAEAKAYVHDTLYVSLRDGQSTEHQILQSGLKSGTPLIVIEEDEETDYSFVRTEAGLEGWVQTQYLTWEPIAQDRLQAAERRMKQATVARDKAAAQAATLGDEVQTLRAELSAAAARSASLEAELADLTRLAANVIEIDEQNKAHTTNLEKMQSEIELLNDLNLELRDSTRQDWFLRGAGVVVAGLLVGFWLARRVYHRRNTGGWS